MSYNKDFEFNEAFKALGRLQNQIGALRDQASDMLDDLLFVQRRIANAMVATADIPLDKKDH